MFLFLPRRRRRRAKREKEVFRGHPEPRKGGFTPLQGGLPFLPATGLIALFTPLTGLIAQWARRRLYVFLILALLAIGALTCLILCGSAAVLAFFIRTRLLEQDTL